MENDLKNLLMESIVQFSNLSFLDPYQSAEKIADQILEKIKQKYHIKPRYSPRCCYEEMAE